MGTERERGREGGRDGEREREKQREREVTVVVCNCILTSSQSYIIFLWGQLRTTEQKETFVNLKKKKKKVEN